MSVASSTRATTASTSLSGRELAAAANASLTLASNLAGTAAGIWPVVRAEMAAAFTPGRASAARGPTSPVAASRLTVLRAMALRRRLAWKKLH